LFALRGEIRTVRKTQCKAVLTHLVNVTTNGKLRLIAIWLRGQCGGYLGKKAIAKLPSADSEAVRLKVAGALQRMSDWSTLKQISVTLASLPGKSQVLERANYKTCSPMRQAHRGQAKHEGYKQASSLPNRSTISGNTKFSACRE